MSATAARTFPVKADARKFDQSAGHFYDALETLAFRVPSIKDTGPADETRPATDENIVALAEMIDRLDAYMGQFGAVRERLHQGLRYLLAVQAEHPGQSNA